MILYPNCEVFASVIFYFVTKIICIFFIWYDNMYKKQPTLTSIPERSENEEDLMATKWVPKKKHEVLKAKYKCLKKLFQIYDASVIGILPEAIGTDGYIEEEIQTKRRRKKRSHRTKTDACAGTTELTSGDITQQSATEVTEKESIASAVIRDLKTPPQPYPSTQTETTHTSNSKELKITAVGTQDSRINMQSMAVEQDCEGTQTGDQHPMPYLVFNDKRRPTRFQCFIHRILGIRDDRTYKNYAMSNNGHIYAASDNTSSQNNNYYSEKRRRRGLRFRRLRRPKKIQSESALRETRNPVIMTYVQSVQKNYLRDTTPRQCPIVGCRMISYGIINYNDHLNLCHFPERKYICHYCHEGFESEYCKFAHENEHIGITKIGTNVSTPSSIRKTSVKRASDTQTDPKVTKCDVPDDKLKQIVSFLEKMSDQDQILQVFKKNRFSESNLQMNTDTVDTAGYTSESSDKRTVSCVNLNRKAQRKYSSAETDATSKRPYSSGATCHLCGEKFDNRRQLSLHVDLEHRVHDKFSKFHSCAGILNTRSSNHVDMVSEDGKINVQSVDRSHSGIRRVSTSSAFSSCTEISRRKSEESLTCDPSMESVKKSSVVNSFVQRVKSGFNSYKWEPGTKIIRV